MIVYYLTRHRGILFLVDMEVKFMNNNYIIEYLNENEYRKKERAIKKYNMLAYKKLLFNFYPAFREGNFLGMEISHNKNENIVKYELKIPTDTMFSKVHGDIILHYSLYKNENIIMLEDITTSDNILTEGHQEELTTYKGVMISKSNAEKDIFKINLLNHF